MSEREKIDYSVYKCSFSELLKLGVVSALILLAIGIIFYKSFVSVFLIIPFFKPLKGWYESHLAGKRKRKLRLEFRDFLNSASASFAAGRHINEVCEIAISELAAMYSEDETIMIELSYLKNKINTPGNRAVDALRDFANRADIEEITNFSEVYGACLESGGDLAGALNKCSRLLSEKISIENDIETMASQKKFEGKIITAMPVLIIIGLNMIAPDYLSIMYSSIIGRILMSAALAITIFAYYLIERITEIEV